jgi:hypothetical protein
MLATVLGVLGIAPLIVGVVVLAAFIATACSGSKDEKDGGVVKDAAPPPKPQCDAFDKGSGKTHIDQQSFDAMNNVWGEDFAKVKTENWHRHTRIYFGATAPLYKTTCENPSLLDGNAGAYMGGVKSFFEDYYATKANSADDGILVLIGGVGPAKLQDTVVTGGLEQMSSASVTQADFAELLTGCYYYNKATEFEGVIDKYSDPSGRKLPKTDKDTAKEWLKLAQSTIDRFAQMDEVALNEALTDRQQELLIALMDAVDSYGRTLKTGKGGGSGDPKCTKTDAECKEKGKRWKLDKIKCICIKEKLGGSINAGEPK